MSPATPEPSSAPAAPDRAATVPSASAPGPSASESASAATGSTSPAPERRLILLRHGETEFNRGRRMQGQLDTDLSDVGRAQARAVAEVLAGRPVGAVVSSDLIRARETAEIVAAGHGLGVRTDHRFRETDLGRWQGLTHREVDGDFPGHRSHWRRTPTWAPPGGESRVDVMRRTTAGVADLLADDALWAGGAVVVVAHGGSISALTSGLLDIPVEHYPMFGGLGNCRWSQLLAVGDDAAPAPQPPAAGSAGDAADAVDAAGQPTTPDAAGRPTTPAGEEARRGERASSYRWVLEGWNVGVGAPPDRGTPNADEGGRS
ncbi:histidine phosphatase family protein [Corynebacterium bovis]|uniref:histidine phosphatase family protein n=1 Tax=Corynebacterium bovis TaxID=36808 RepID=UPI0024474A8A|nr:histidine phosphatase family protein [Corynebacterium bovis]MDH2456123.1 histidine phosphatase family protein [Corynebacterium bovis]